MEFPSVTPTSASGFAGDLGMNVHRKSQKCLLCECHIWTDTQLWSCVGLLGTVSCVDGTATATFAGLQQKSISGCFRFCIKN